MKKNWKRIGTLCMALCMAVSLLSPAALAETGGGLPEGASPRVSAAGHWAAKDLTDWAEKGWLKGNENGDLMPDVKVTRAQFMAFINRMMDYTTLSAKVAEYADVAGGAWYYDDVAIALEAGYIQGSGGLMRPDDEISRQEAVVILSRLAGFAEAEVDAEYLALASDADTLPDWAQAAVSVAVREGLIAGVDGKFEGARGITRAESVVLLNRFDTGTRVFGFAGVYGGTAAAPMEAAAVVIAASGITLKHAVVAGNLEVGAGVGEGEATLEDIVVKGSLNISGGGMNSVYLIRVTVMDELGVYKDDVRIVIVDMTDIETVKLYAAALIDASGAKGDKLNIEIVEIPEDGQVELIGNFGSVTNTVPGLKLKITGSVGTLILEASATVTGGAAITRAEISKEAGKGTSLDSRPGTITGAGANDADIPPLTGTGGGGGGSTPSYSITGNAPNSTYGIASDDILGELDSLGYGSYQIDDDDIDAISIFGILSTDTFQIGYTASNNPAAKTVLAFKLSAQNAANVDSACLLAYDGEYDGIHYVWDVLGNDTYPLAEGAHGQTLTDALADGGYTGYWGPVAGRDIGGGYTKALDTYYFFAEEEDTYTLTIDLIDITGGTAAVKASKTVTITVVDEPVAGVLGYTGGLYEPDMVVTSVLYYDSANAALTAAYNNSGSDLIAISDGETLTASATVASNDTLLAQSLNIGTHTLTVKGILNCQDIPATGTGGKLLLESTSEVVYDSCNLINGDLPAIKLTSGTIEISNSTELTVTVKGAAVVTAADGSNGFEDDTYSICIFDGDKYIVDTGATLTVEAGGIILVVGGELEVKGTLTLAGNGTVELENGGTVTGTGTYPKPTVTGATAGYQCAVVSLAGYYKVTVSGESDTYYVKADGTLTTDIGEVGELAASGRIIGLDNSKTYTVTRATAYEGNVDYNYSHSASSGYVNKSPTQPFSVAASSGVAAITIDGAVTDPWYELSLGALFAASGRLEADRDTSTFQFAILGRSSEISNGFDNVVAGPFYVWEFDEDNGGTVVWQAYKTPSGGGQTVAYPDNASFLGLFINDANIGGMEYQINLGGTATTRTFVFDCDNGEFIFLTVTLQ